MSLQFTSFDRQPEQRRGVLLYLRVSKEEQADRRNSLEEQRRRLERHFRDELGLEILGVYADEGASAFKDDEKRENFWRMIERAKNDPRVGIIAVDEESRFYRNRYRAAAIKGELLDYGIRVLTVRRDTDPRTMAGLWQESIEETMAHAHSLANREYTMRGMAGNVHSRDPQTGWAFKNGGPAPYGWRNKRIEMGRDAKGRSIHRTIWELDPPAAEVRRQILLWRADGWSYQQIRDELNRRRVPAPRSKLWSEATIVGICREDMVWTAAGYSIWNKHYRKGRPKGLKFKPTNEWEVEPNAHPAIISEEEARRVLAVNSAHRRAHDHGFRKLQVSPYLLTGENRDGAPLFVCGACGARVIGQKAGRGRRKYVCSTKAYKGTQYCPSERVDAERLEQMVIDVLRQRFTEGYIREVIRAANEMISKEAKDRPEDLRHRRLREIETRLERIRQSVLAGFDPAVWADEVKALMEEKAALLNAPPEETEVAAARFEPIPEDRAEEIVQELVAALHSEETKERRRLVRSLVRQVTLAPRQRSVFLELHPDPLDLNAPTLYQYRDIQVPPTGREDIAIPLRAVR